MVVDKDWHVVIETAKFAERWDAGVHQGQTLGKTLTRFVAMLLTPDIRGDRRIYSVDSTESASHKTVLRSYVDDSAKPSKNPSPT